MLLLASAISVWLKKVSFSAGGGEKKVLFLVRVSPPYGQTGSCSPQMSPRPPPYGPGVLRQMET